MDAISITVDFSLRAAKPTPPPYRVRPFRSFPHARREGGNEKGVCRYFVLLSSFSRRLKTAGYRNVTPSGLGRTLRVCLSFLCALCGLKHFSAAGDCRDPGLSMSFSGTLDKAASSRRAPRNVTPTPVLYSVKFSPWATAPPCSRNRSENGQARPCDWNSI